MANHGIIVRCCCCWSTLSKCWEWKLRNKVSSVGKAKCHFHGFRRYGITQNGPYSGYLDLVLTPLGSGMGPTSLHVTRSWRQYTDNLPYDDTLYLDKHIIGTSRTRSSNSLVTDSAAGATAFSCGKKSYNGAISVLPDHSPCGTVLEAAKKAGYKTGLVVTTRITE